MALPLECQLERLADLVPPLRKHRHHEHGVFVPNHKLWRAVTTLAIGNIGKGCDAGGHAGNAIAMCCCDTDAKPRSHNTARIARAKLMARLGEQFRLECPNYVGNIRLISFITKPGPIRKILTLLGEPLEPPPVSPARGPPTDWTGLVKVHDDRDIYQAAADELPAIDIHSLWPLPDASQNKTRVHRIRRDSALMPEEATAEGEIMWARKGLVRARRQEQAAHEPTISEVIIPEVPLAGLCLNPRTTAYTLNLLWAAVGEQVTARYVAFFSFRYEIRLSAIAQKAGQTRLTKFQS